MANDANLELCDLTVEAPRGQMQTQQFGAVHRGFCTTSELVVANSAARISKVRRGNGPLDRFLILLTLIEPDVDLAPDPAFGAAGLADVPFAFALALDPPPDCKTMDDADWHRVTSARATAMQQVQTTGTSSG